MTDHVLRAVGAQRRLPDADYADPDEIFFVTICASERTTPFVNNRLAACVAETIDWLRENRGVSVYAWCLMPDHLHLLVRLGPQGKDLGSIVRSLKRFTTRESWRLGYEGKLWQDRFYDHILRESEDALDIAEYIRQNPVRKGLVLAPEEYRWSGMPDPM